MGSARGLSDAAGSVTDTYRYDAYGELSAQSGDSGNAYLYRGEQYDPELEAYYLRARYYQPGSGRFLTTDPVEGFPTKPMTQHRYLYANNNPIMYVDPSGRNSLSEILTTAAIVGGLNTIGVGLSYGPLNQFYTDLAKNFFPDAFAMGISFSGTMNLGYIFSLPFWDILSNAIPIGVVIGPHIMGGGGGEVLLSVSSGEVAFYKTWFLGGALGLDNPLQVKADLYKGFVWNLWNAKNYNGAFHAVSGSFGKTVGSGGVFWDAKEGYTGGSWGVGRTLASGGWPNILTKEFGQWTLAFSRTSYKMMQRRRTLHPTIVTAAIVGLTLAGNTIEYLANMSYMGPGPIRFYASMLEISMWVQTGAAKHHWGKKEPEYSYKKRRLENSPRPDGFQSGPGFLGTYVMGLFN